MGESRNGKRDRQGDVGRGAISPGEEDNSDEEGCGEGEELQEPPGWFRETRRTHSERLSDHGVETVAVRGQSLVARHLP